MSIFFRRSPFLGKSIAKNFRHDRQITRKRVNRTRNEHGQGFPPSQRAEGAIHTSAGALVLLAGGEQRNGGRGGERRTKERSPPTYRAPARARGARAGRRKGGTLGQPPIDEGGTAAGGRAAAIISSAETPARGTKTTTGRRKQGRTAAREIACKRPPAADRGRCLPREGRGHFHRDAGRGDGRSTPEREELRTGAGGPPHKQTPGETGDRESRRTGAPGGGKRPILRGVGRGEGRTNQRKG